MTKLPPLLPALNFAPELLLRAQGIKLVFFDVDGVLTDGGLYFGSHEPSSVGAQTQEPLSGETLKRFSVLDGHGLKQLSKIAITPVMITGRDSAVLRARLQALGIAHAYFGVDDKNAVAQSVLQNLGLDWACAAAMGDDWPDLPLLRRAAFSCAPSNAHAEVKAVAHYITNKQGGHGAVRELCDLLAVASGHYARLLAEHAQ